MAAAFFAYHAMFASTINIILFFLAAGIPLLINPLALNSVELIKRQSAYVLVCLLVTCALAMAPKKNPLRVYALPLTLPLMLFALSACLATVFSVNPGFSLHGDPCRGESLFTIITYVLLSFIFAFCIQSFEQALSLIRALCIATAIICVYAIIEFLCLQKFGISPLQHFRPPELRQTFISSTMGNANFLGRYLVLVLPLFAACAVKATWLKSPAMGRGRHAGPCNPYADLQPGKRGRHCCRGSCVFCAYAANSRPGPQSPIGPDAWGWNRADYCPWPYLTGTQRFRPARFFFHHCQSRDIGP